MSQTNEWRKAKFLLLPEELRQLWTDPHKLPYKQKNWKGFQKLVYEDSASLLCVFRPGAVLTLWRRQPGAVHVSRGRRRSVAAGRRPGLQRQRCRRQQVPCGFIWFLDATPAEHESNRCTACARGLTNPRAAMIRQAVLGARRRAFNELVDGAWRPREVPLPFDEAMEVKLINYLDMPDVRDSCIGMPYEDGTGVYYQVTVDSIECNGYGAPVLLPDGTAR